jgi:hypothetical protein
VQILTSVLYIDFVNTLVTVLWIFTARAAMGPLLGMPPYNEAEPGMTVKAKGDYKPAKSMKEKRPASAAHFLDHKVCAIECLVFQNAKCKRWRCRKNASPEIRRSVQYF